MGFYQRRFWVAVVAVKERGAILDLDTNSRLPSGRMKSNWTLINLRALFLFVLLLQDTLQAGAIRMSFLNDDISLRETLDFLRTAGCKEDAVASFQKMVGHYNSTPLQFNLIKLSQSQNGYFIFQSSAELLAALPGRLCDIPHRYEINCYDTVIVLAGENFRVGLHPDDYDGSLLPIQIAPNGDSVYARVETAREAFNYSYPTWYRDFSKPYFPSAMADARINLTAALYCFHALPSSANRQDLRGQVMNVLSASWKNQSISFPSGFQVILCHYVKPANHLIDTAHAGLLFPAKSGYTYLEKAGGQGPFVRLDFGGRTDLMAWLAAKWAKKDGDYVFVTFNDSEIEMLNPF